MDLIITKMPISVSETVQFSPKGIFSMEIGNKILHFEESIELLHHFHFTYFGVLLRNFN